MEWAQGEKKVIESGMKSDQNEREIGSQKGVIRRGHIGKMGKRQPICA